MPEVRYVIEIRGEQTAENKKTTASTPNGKTEKESWAVKKATDLFSVGAGYHYAKSAVTTAISFQNNTVALRTGNEKQQENIQQAYSVGMKLWGIAESAFAGLMLGGPAGAAVGAGIAAVGTVVSTGVQMALQGAQIGLERQLESIGIQQANIRAGAGGDRIGRNTY